MQAHAPIIYCIAHAPIIYHIIIAQKFDGGKFDEWLGICQSFPYKPLSLNEHTINSSKFYLSNFCE